VASKTIAIKFQRLGHASGLPCPSPATSGSSGCDIAAAVDAGLTLAPGKRALVPTGFCVEIPAGYEIQVRPRSGLAAKHGITVLNTPGTIDSDYRGEIKIILINLGDTAFTVNRGDRIAQLVVAAVAGGLEISECAELGATERGSGGFGHSGI